MVMITAGGVGTLMDDWHTYICRWVLEISTTAPPSLRLFALSSHITFP